MAKADIVSNCFTKSLILLKQPKNLLQVKKLSKISIFYAIFLKDKAQKCNPINLYIFNKTGTFIPCSATYFMEVSAHVSLKVAARASFRGKKS